ncbi:MAG: DUF2326 domain-containing protein, partial [Bacteroidia bacterium]|nr:DUF2326 domain-containing protein [Bacteroidia bacterium]
KKGTYNSTGKSLLIFLIHFCLGASESNELKEKLPDWEFYLDIEIGDLLYTITRNTWNQKIIKLNDKEFKINEFTDFIQSKVFFNIPDKFKYLSFRSLINRFIRPQKASYDTYNCFLKEEKPYQEILNNCFLLGLNIEKIDNKREIREEWDKTKDSKSNIEKDPVMQEFFKGDSENKKIDIEIITLEKKLQQLSSNISNFKVAEDYDYIKKEADKISSNLAQHKNQRTIITLAIKNILRSLEIKSDIKANDIKKLYEEANVLLSDSIKKRFEEVENFNRKLLSNRQARLLEERKKFEKQLSEIESRIQKLGQLEDEKLYLLKSTGSLEEYAKLNEQHSQFQVKFEKLRSYKDLIDQYKSKIDEIKEKLAKENKETNEYLRKSKALQTRNIQVFSSFAEQFYANKSAGVIIENDEGDNQNRFKIEATIDSDSGDGVNNVKIFCFDWTLLKNQNNHHLQFIFHDSRLISEIDPRQIATMFQIAFFNSNEYGFQYIISANQKELDAIKAEFSVEEYQKYIENNIVEELTDNSDAGKLLGITVSLNYER